MLNELRGFFGLKHRLDPGMDTTVEPDDLRLAAGVLLVAAAAADGALDAAEGDFILDAVEEKFALPREKVEEFLKTAAAAHDQTTLEHFISVINSQFSLEHREKILSLVWAVILIDQQATKAESSFAANLRVSLGLSIEQALRARKTAEGVGIDGFKEILEASPEVRKATHSLGKTDVD